MLVAAWLGFLLGAAWRPSGHAAFEVLKSSGMGDTLCERLELNYPVAMNPYAFIQGERLCSVPILSKRQ
jgi:hypothetical protein